jgi:hypothetical protein
MHAHLKKISGHGCYTWLAKSGDPEGASIDALYKLFALFTFICVILQTTRHKTHTHASSTIHLLGKCPCGQMSFWANVFLGKCLSGQMSFWANVFWANVFWANVHLGKCLSGQMSSGQMLFWANVVLGKCIWLNVSGQMSYGQISYHRVWVHACMATLNSMVHQSAINMHPGCRFGSKAVPFGPEEDNFSSSSIGRRKRKKEEKELRVGTSTADCTGPRRTQNTTL